MPGKICFVVMGPTAVGKTAAAIRLAQHLHTDIISADSRQCYREMNIGVAKPTAAQLALVKHYFINSHSIHDDVTAASFEEYALHAAAEIFAHNDTAVMVGGTGLYIKAFCEGMDHIPAIASAIREEVITNYEEKGLPWLQQQLQEKDPLFAAQGEMQNPQRMMRALEVILATGESIRSFQTGKKAVRDFQIVRINLELPKELLYEQINTRVDQMIEEGLVEEVESLYSYRSLNALQTVGYTEIFDYLDRKIPIEEAISLIKRNTRHYAKRQVTWFKKFGAEYTVDLRQEPSLGVLVDKELQ